MTKKPDCLVTSSYYSIDTTNHWLTSFDIKGRGYYFFSSVVQVTVKSNKTFCKIITLSATHDNLVQILARICGIWHTVCLRVPLQRIWWAVSGPWVLTRDHFYSSCWKLYCRMSFYHLQLLSIRLNRELLFHDSTSASSLLQCRLIKSLRCWIYAVKMK